LWCYKRSDDSQTCFWENLKGLGMTGVSVAGISRGGNSWFQDFL